MNVLFIQVSRNVQILIRETFIYMTMDTEHNAQNPAIPFHMCQKIVMSTSHMYSEIMR